MVIDIISDGKRGHLTQTRGLARALVRQAQKLAPGTTHSVHELDVSALSLMDKLCYKGEEGKSPDLVVCAGHGTHPAALHLAHCRRCPCIVCMKPSLPTSWFDLCIIPRHDYPEGRSVPQNVLLTQGALNSIVPDPGAIRSGSLILVGGPSRDFGWDEDQLLTQLASLARYNEGQITLTTSRRTPSDFAHAVRVMCPSIHVVPVEETGEDWVPTHLATAENVWVTQDSVSMVYEALSSGAPVGILEMQVHPKRVGKEPGRVSRGLTQLVKEQRVTTFTQWLKTRSLLPGCPLQESLRVADIILAKYPSLLT